MPEVTARGLQSLLAGVFLGLGGWVLTCPGQVERLSLRKEYQHNSDTSKLTLGCFGAQAVLCGTVIATSEFTSRTFLAFGLLGSIPFFGFNYYFVYVKRMFTKWMALDFLGNASILALCMWGWKLKQNEESGAQKLLTAGRP